MKKLLLGIAVLLAATGMAMAGSVSFSVPAVTETLAGNVVVVPISAIGSGALQGMNLVLQVDAPLEIVALPLAGGFASNNTGWAPILFPTAPTAQLAMGSVTSNSGTTVALGDLVNVSVRVPAGTAMGDYVLQTQIPDMGMVSDWAGSLDVVEGAQGLGIIRVVPEPASALMLLGALPLLRRRHA